MLNLLIIVSPLTLQIFFNVLFLLDLAFVFVGQLPRHHFVVQINNGIFLNDFQVSLLFFSDNSFFLLLNAILIGLFFHLVFSELLLLLSNVKHFLVVLVFKVFLDRLVGVLLLVLMRQCHRMFALLLTSLDTIIQTDDLLKEFIAFTVDFLVVFELLHDCDHLFELIMELLLFTFFFILLYQIVILSFVHIYLILMLLLSIHRTI